MEFSIGSTFNVKFSSTFRRVEKMGKTVLGCLLGSSCEYNYKTFPLEYGQAKEQVESHMRYVHPQVGTADKEQKTLPRTQKKKKKRCALYMEDVKPLKKEIVECVSSSAARLEYIEHMEDVKPLKKEIVESDEASSVTRQLIGVVEEMTVYREDILPPLPPRLPPLPLLPPPPLPSPPPPPSVTPPRSPLPEYSLPHYP